MTIDLERFPNMQGAGILPRTVDVWLPPQYHEQPQRHFPVVYMHDGQNLFEPKLSYSGTTWGVAEAITALSAAGEIEPAIVVGVYNTRNRVGDYLPQRPFETLWGRIVSAIPRLRFSRRVAFVADDYLRFLVGDLKPFIDGRFRSLPDTEHTSIMGSSMGGLISLYALCEYPEVYGAAGCLSTHWPVLQRVMRRYLRRNLPEAGVHRLYCDRGTVGLDARYTRGQQRMDRIAGELGYRSGRDYVSRVFEGHDHRETAWRSRIEEPLRLLLGTR